LPKLKKQINLREDKEVQKELLRTESKDLPTLCQHRVIILSIMGLIVSARSPWGSGSSDGSWFHLAFVYILFHILSKVAETGNERFFAVWLPNIVFTSIAFVMYYTVQ
jgi:hypothetical protein